jgi:NADH-quinone oxidoreductase subunit F
MAVKLLLENDHIEGIRYYDTYRKHGGYRAAEKALKMAPADIVEEVKKSGLRGRGGQAGRCATSPGM